MKAHLIVWALVTIVSSSGCGRCLGDELKDQKMVSVKAEDISKTVQIIGRLGQPLGSLVTIRGAWVSPGNRAKDRSLQFHVSHVNGNELAEKVKLSPGQISMIFSHTHSKGRGPKPGELWDWKSDWGGRMPPPERTEGEVWEMLGVEMGFFDQYSADAAQEIRLYLVQQPSYRTGFVSIFVTNQPSEVGIG